MKLGKITSMLMALCMLVTLAVLPAAAESSTNNLIDSSFEEWGTTGVLEGWQATNMSLISTSGEVKSDGEYSAKIEAAGTQRRVALYQNIGKLPLKAKVNVSVKLNAARFSGSGARLIIRFGSQDSSTYWGPSEKVDAPTNGWKELTVSGTVNETAAAMDAFVVLDIMNNSADYELYMDACKVDIEPFKVEITNGDFENGGTDWAFSSGATVETSIVTEGENSYVKFTAHAQRMARTIRDLTPGAHYRISYDMRSNHDVGYVDIGTTSTQHLWAGETGDAWERRYFTWVQADDKETYDIRFMFHNGNKAAKDGAYVMFDNIVIEEIDPEEYLTSGGFEYGANGLQNWIRNANGTVSQVSDAVEGNYALHLENTTGDNMISSSALVMPAHSATVYYEYSAYVKMVTMAEGAQVILSSEVPDTTHDFFGPAHFAANEWVKISKIVVLPSDKEKCTLRFRLRGEGEVSVDKISLRVLSAPAISFAKTNGAYTEKMENGIKAKINMPATETGMAVLAVYKRTDNKTAIADIKVQGITAADVTKGYKTFTLSAASLADYDSVNYYAKLMLFKNGTLVPVINDILLTK